MSSKKHKPIQKVISRTSDVCGSKSVEECEEVKKISISFHKFTIIILEETKKDIEELMGYTKCSMKEAIGMLLDLGSLTYKTMIVQQKGKLKRFLEETKKEKKEQGEKNG